MKMTSRWVPAIAIGLWSLAAPGTLAFGQPIHGRWDIVSVEDGVAWPGGFAFARANDGTSIKLSGSGSFVASGTGRRWPAVAIGGGTWETRGIAGSNVAGGTYRVTGLVLFEPGPQPPPGVPLPVIDRVGLEEEATTGLLVLRVAYSDGSQGILVVSSRLEGTLDGLFEDSTATIFEGVTATKGFTDFWWNVPTSRILLHVRPLDPHERDERD